MSGKDAFTIHLQGNSKGACIHERFGARQRWLRCINRARSSKLELAYLQLSLLAHLQSNMFVHFRLFLPPAKPDARFGREYISSPSFSAHQFASRGQFDAGTLRYSALFCAFANLACLSPPTSRQKWAIAGVGWCMG